MAYKDLKDHEGQPYAGMRIGRGHHWNYLDAKWKETKLEPRKWGFRFTSRKERVGTAPDDTGCDVGSQFHWLLVAHQYVRKVDANAYDTLMAGQKYLVAYRKPKWLMWSSEYEGAVPEADIVSGILVREAMDEMGVKRRVVVPDGSGRPLEEGLASAKVGSA